MYLKNKDWKCVSSFSLSKFSLINRENLCLNSVQTSSKNTSSPLPPRPTLEHIELENGRRRIRQDLHSSCLAWSWKGPRRYLYFVVVHSILLLNYVVFVYPRFSSSANYAFSCVHAQILLCLINPFEICISWNKLITGQWNYQITP